MKFGLDNLPAIHLFIESNCIMPEEYTLAQKGMYKNHVNSSSKPD